MSEQTKQILAMTPLPMAVKGSQERHRVRDVGDPRRKGDRVVQALLILKERLLLQLGDRDMNAELPEPNRLDRLHHVEGRLVGIALHFHDWKAPASGVSRLAKEAARLGEII